MSQIAKSSVKNLMRATWTSSFRKTNSKTQKFCEKLAKFDVFFYAAPQANKTPGLPVREPRCAIFPRGANAQSPVGVSAQSFVAPVT